MRKSLSRRFSPRHEHSSLLAAGIATGCALAATAILVRQAARAAERRHPPRGRFVTVRGIRLHYHERGEGEPIVLLHGNGATGEDFLACGLVDALAQRYRVIAFDRPGFGYSDRPRWHAWTPLAQADLLRTAFTQLQIEHPVVVGHSWATMVVLALAMRHPQSLRGAMLLSGYYYPRPRLDVALQSPPAIPGVGDLMRYTVSPLLGRLLTPLMIRRLFWPLPVPEAFRAANPPAMQNRPWQLRAAAEEAALMMPAAAKLSKEYEKVKVPVTIVAGDKDLIADYREQAMRLHRELPQSKLVILPGVGHMTHYAAAGQLALAIDDLVYQRHSLTAPLAPLGGSAAPVEAKG